MKLRILMAVLVSASLSTVAVAQDAAAPATPPAAEAAAAQAPAAAPADAAAVMAELAQSSPGNAEAGAAKAAPCAACHGLDGNSSDPQYPKVAGQHERFIARQLAMFKSGARVNPIMQPFAAPLSAQDMRDLGAYFAQQKVVAGLADETAITGEHSPYKDQRIVDVGRRIYVGGIRQTDVPACMACHGPSGGGNPGPSYPALGGQHAGYTGAMLKTYKATALGDTRLNDANYAIMATIAQRLSDEEILAVSSYIEGLHARQAAVAGTAAAPSQH
jgi:cytochrome c553